MTTQPAANGLFKTDGTVTVYRASEPQPEPGWRLVNQSAETATTSYEVPQDIWDAYARAEREFARATAALATYITETPAPR